MKLNTQMIEVVTAYEVMPLYRGNITKAAIDLGVSRGSMRKYIKSRGDYLIRVYRDDSGEIARLEKIR